MCRAAHPARKHASSERHARAPRGRGGGAAPASRPAPESAEFRLPEQLLDTFGATVGQPRSSRGSGVTLKFRPKLTKFRPTLVPKRPTLVDIWPMLVDPGATEVKPPRPERALADPSATEVKPPRPARARALARLFSARRRDLRQSAPYAERRRGCAKEWPKQRGWAGCRGAATRGAMHTSAMLKVCGHVVLLPPPLPPGATYSPFSRRALATHGVAMRRALLRGLQHCGHTGRSNEHAHAAQTNDGILSGSPLARSSNARSAAIGGGLSVCLHSLRL